MATATLSIDLEAKMARFEADLGRASRSLDKLASDAKGSFSGVRDVFAGSMLSTAVTEGIRQVVDLFPRLIEGVAAFQDMSETTGASAAGLAAFQTAADVSGVSVDTLAGLTIKLTSNLGKITEDSKGAGQALANLGIPIKDFRALRPDEQIQLLSARFNEFQDGVGKTSNALALFGKTGPQILRFFKEYGDGSASVTRLTADQIAQADAYADAHARMRSELKQSAQVLAVQALPAITALGEGFSTGAKKIFGLQTAAGELKADTAILDFAETGAIAVGTLAEGLIGVVKLVGAVKGSFSAVAADIGFVATVARAAPADLGNAIINGTGPVAAALAERNKTLADANARYVDLWTYNGTAVTDALRKSFQQQRLAMDSENQREAQRMRERAASVAGSKAVLASVLVPDSDSKAADSAFARFMAQIAQRQEAARYELATNDKLAESDRFRIEVTQQLAKAEDKLGPAQRAKVEVALARTVAIMGEVEAMRDLDKARKAAQAIEDRQYQAVQAEVSSRISATKTLRDQVEEIGLNAEQLRTLTLTRMAHTLAIEEEAQAAQIAAGATAEMVQAGEASLNLLRQQIELRRQGDAKTRDIATDPLRGATDAVAEYQLSIQEGGKATKAVVSQSINLLEDDLTTSLKNGQSNVSRTVDFMIGEFLRLQVVRPLLGSLFNAGGAIATTTLTSIFAPGRATGGPVAGGGLYQVNETGAPELLSVGDKQFLMMGRQSGQVTPMGAGRGTGGQGAGVVNNYITVAAGPTRGEVAAGVQMAIAASEQRMLAMLKANRILPQ